ncbi:MAG: glycosyltransferase family 39 protein, partial [Bacteroidia bacterium]|nr:glycosyltransferase family 39 protein [Bacteroidia bacterium]
MSKDRKKEKFSSNSKNHSLFDNNYFIGIVLFVFSILLYQNTFNNGYALDDHTVISANKFTKQGISAITTIFTHAYWFGYDGSNNAVYRPFSLIIFAIEYDLFGKSAKISHIINVTLYGLTGILLFLTLLKLFKNNASIPKVNVRTISLVVSLLFLAHPIHTEVVANIKSRDEILSLLFVLFSIYLIFSYLKSNAIKHLLGGLICFLIALLSKETIFSFIAIIPILLYCFTNEHKHSIIKLSSGYLIVGAIYLLLRISFLNKSFSGDFANDVMTNSLLATNGYLDRLASCFFILLKYIALFLYPKDLTYDYSFNQIPNLEFFDLKSIASILIIIGLLLFAIKKLPSKNIFSFSILYFFISISIVSNIVIIIGAPMAERFAYVPSLGFCIALGYFLVLISDKIKFLTNHPQVKVFSLLAILLLAYSFKTVSRNNAWKNNLTLFETDIETSNNSSRAH